MHQSFPGVRSELTGGHELQVAEDIHRMELRRRESKPCWLLEGRLHQTRLSSPGRSSPSVTCSFRSWLAQPHPRDCDLGRRRRWNPAPGVLDLALGHTSVMRSSASFSTHPCKCRSGAVNDRPAPGDLSHWDPPGVGTLRA
jgi:hypothetical protein